MRDYYGRRHRRPLTALAQTFRHKPTATERQLWRGIRLLQLGVKFRRQMPLECYVADFFCAELKLIVEIDGEIHEQQELKDRIRQRLLEEGNLTFLRFTRREVAENLPAVLERIRAFVEERQRGGATPR